MLGHLKLLIHVGVEGGLIGEGAQEVLDGHPPFDIDLSLLLT